MSVVLAPEVYKAVLECLPIGVYLVDRDRKIVLWNEGAEKISGYLRQEVLGRSCSDDLLMHCDDNDNVLCGEQCPLLATMHDGQLREARVFLRHKDGQRVPVQLRAVPFRDENGILLGAVECFSERVMSPDAGLNPHNREVHDHLDDLTGVPDRASIQSHLKACLEDYTEQRLPFGVLSIAVDNLEQVRLARGKKCVEAVVRVVARTLARNLRPTDMVGRWEEGRFLAIIVNCPAAALSRAAEMFRHIVRYAEVTWWGDRFSATISVGGAVVRDDDTAETLSARAEQALQACVAAGGKHAVIQ